VVINKMIIGGGQRSLMLQNDKMAWMVEMVI